MGWGRRPGRRCTGRHALSSGRSPAHRPVWTLQEAHEQAAREWPGRHATAEALRGYYELVAHLFEQAALADPDHQHEARYLAREAAQTARGYAAQILPSPASDQTGTGAGAGIAAPPAPVSSTIPLSAKEQQ